ncbi:hypothetical protein DER46DRAFT_554056 [Fusarium sp. MPI-SDFR-AT-0072]|nr:hypothetical protein DER46DRAFT_554056 [Fusarium sp. MPI-SDFR-AT-0072]
MGQFRSLAAYLVKEINRLCDNLMFGLEPDVDLAKIKDNMANCEKGYSFVTDPKNELTPAYLDLFKRACTARSGCLSKGNSWNWSEVNQYLKKEESFRELLGTGMSLTGGQQPRWPELSSLWVENGELGPRGLYVYKGYFIYVVRHHKAKSSTNREFVVVRFLPAELALAVFKYCAYIRPFINLLDRERGIASPNEAGQSSSPLLFRSQTVSSGSKVWRTSRFTNVIRKVTTEAWGFAVNSRLLRQICIGITEKHVREVYQPFNRFDDRSKDAHRNVVFAWQSGHGPLQRGSTYGLDGAFPTTMQPQLLDLYEWASLRWHEFLHLPSKLTPRTNAQADSDRERILGYQSKLTSRGTEEILTAETPGSENQMTSVQRQHRGSGASTIRHHHNSSTKRSNHELGGSKDTSPPAKRRRTIPVSLIGHDVRDQFPNEDDWSYWPLFGYPGDIATYRAMTRRQAVLDHLHSRLGFSDDENLSRAKIKLWNLGGQLEKWATVGCQLCYIRGDMGLDHNLDDCTTEGSEVAQRLLAWLQTLRLDRFIPSVTNCSLCAEIDQICEDVNLGLQVSCAGTEEEKDGWRQRYSSTKNPDGFCGNKPAIRRTIAALCAFDEQILGKTLTTFVSRQNDIDLTTEGQAVEWFEQTVTHGETWVPQLLVAFDILVTAFELLRNRPEKASRRADQGQFDSSGPPEEQHSGLPSLKMSWGDDDEVAEWKVVMDWWLGKCSFCAGRGVRGPQIEHSLRRCPFGGKQLLRTDLAEAIYEEGFQALGGCPACALPREVCEVWSKNASGEWHRDKWARCQYGRQAYDTAIGLFNCKNSRYRIGLVESMADEGLNEFDGEEVAMWLGKKIEVIGIESSEIMRQLRWWSNMLWESIKNT